MYSSSTQRGLKSFCSAGALSLCQTNQTATVEHRVSCWYSSLVLWLHVVLHFPFVITDCWVQHIWDLWWAKWHCERFCPHLFRFSLSVPFHHWCILIHLSTLDVMRQCRQVTTLRSCYSLLSFHVHSFLCALSCNALSFCSPFHFVFQAFPCPFYLLFTSFEPLFLSFRLAHLFCSYFACSCRQNVTRMDGLQKCFMRAAKEIEQSVLLDWQRRKVTQSTRWPRPTRCTSSTNGVSRNTAQPEDV